MYITKTDIINKLIIANSFSSHFLFEDEQISCSTKVCSTNQLQEGYQPFFKVPSRMTTLFTWQFISPSIQLLKNCTHATLARLGVESRDDDVLSLMFCTSYLKLCPLSHSGFPSSPCAHFMIRLPGSFVRVLTGITKALQNLLFFASI